MHSLTHHDRTMVATNDILVNLDKHQDVCPGRRKRLQGGAVLGSTGEQGRGLRDFSGWLVVFGEFNRLRRSEAWGGSLVRLGANLCSSTSWLHDCRQFACIH